MSGGRNEEFEGERRRLIDSPKVATYDLKPEMSAYEVKDALLEELDKGDLDLIILNFANPDMVGHLLNTKISTVINGKNIVIPNAIFETLGIQSLSDINILFKD